MTDTHQTTLEDVSADLDPDETSTPGISSDQTSAPDQTSAEQTDNPAPERPKKVSKKQAKIVALEDKIRQLEAGPTTGPTTRRRLLLPLVAGVAIVVLAAALGVTGLKLRHADQVSSARTAALATARVYGADLSSYNYQHLSTDFGAVTDHSTASFAKTFSKQTALLEPVLTKYKATAQATVLAAGVTSASADRVVVVILVSQKVTNSVQKHGSTTQRSQVVLTLVHQHGHWLLDAAQLL